MPEISKYQKQPQFRMKRGKGRRSVVEGAHNGPRGVTKFGPSNNSGRKYILDVGTFYYAWTNAGYKGE